MLDTLFLLVQGQKRLFAHWKVCSWYLSQSESCFRVWAHRFLHPTCAAARGMHTQHWDFQASLHWRVCLSLQHNWLQQQMLKLPKGRRIVTRESALSHVASKPLLRESWQRHWILAAGQAYSGMCLGGGIVIEWCGCAKLSQWSHSSQRTRLISHQVDITVPLSNKHAKEWLGTDQWILFCKNSNWDTNSDKDHVCLS